MVHLTSDALSELLDGGQVVGAERHLAECAECRGELEAMTRLRGELRELPQLEPPAELWSAIAERLPGGGSRRFGLRGVKLAALQVAAMAAVFVIGLGVGRWVRSGGPATEDDATVPSQVSQQPQAQAQAPASLADALAEVQRLSSQYDDALRNLERLAAEEGQPAPSMAAHRLASLNALVEASRTALATNPGDEVLNAYLFAALEERDAVMRQINAQPGSGSTNRWR